jgi:hypothetical protein
MKCLSAFCVAALLAAAPAAASAATVVVNQTLDLNQAGFASSGFTYSPVSAAGPPFSVDIAEGDTFDLTIDFVGQQQLTLTGPVTIWALAYGSPVSQVTGTGTLSLLDTSGAVILTSNVKTDTEGDVHFGQYFNDPDFAGGLPGTLTFGGVHYVGTLDDYADPALTSRTYDQGVSLVLDARGISVSQGVPEPGAWAMALLGLAGIGAALRGTRRREEMLGA